MGRAPCCDKSKVKRGPWSPEEDATLKNYLHNNGTADNWITLPQKAGLLRCGKSCRLRWLNYLRPDIKHGPFTPEEDTIIFSLYNKLGSRWSVIASKLQGRTDNDVKNHWNTKLKKKFMAAKESNFTTNPPPLCSPISTPSPAKISPKIEAYNIDPGFSTLVNYDSQQVTQSLIDVNYGVEAVNNFQENSRISDSSSLFAAMDGNYGINPVDLGTGFSCDLMSNGVWNNLQDDHQMTFEEAGVINPYANSYVNSVMCQNVTNMFY